MMTLNHLFFVLFNLCIRPTLSRSVAQRTFFVRRHQAFPGHNQRFSYFFAFSIAPLLTDPFLDQNDIVSKFSLHFIQTGKLQVFSVSSGGSTSWTLGYSDFNNLTGFTR